ncbi:MAG: YSIRK-type signal peptide-containing protein, partial [Ligilactobacillus salivarius]|nr:YSIRK-type signal peptide-containing protein [Ligilactobacillus salivarius]
MQRRKSFFNNEMEQRFSLRKYTIGLCSVCLGFVVIGMGSQTVKADTVNNVEKSSVVQENKTQDADSANTDVLAESKTNASDSSVVKPNTTPIETKKNEAGSVDATAPKTNTTSNGANTNTATPTETKLDKANSAAANSNNALAQTKLVKAESVVQSKVNAVSTEVKPGTANPASLAKIKPQRIRLAKLVDANEQSITITYVDDDGKGQTVGSPVTITGKTGQTVATNITVPENYDLSTLQNPLPKQITFTDKAIDPIIVHLKHQTEYRDVTKYFEQSASFSLSGPYGAFLTTPSDSVMHTIDQLISIKGTHKYDLVTRNFIGETTWDYSHIYQEYPRKSTEVKDLDAINSFGDLDKTYVNLDGIYGLEFSQNKDLEKLIDGAHDDSISTQTWLKDGLHADGYYLSEKSSLVFDGKSWLNLKEYQEKVDPNFTWTTTNDSVVMLGDHAVDHINPEKITSDLLPKLDSELTGMDVGRAIFLNYVPYTYKHHSAQRTINIHLPNGEVKTITQKADSKQPVFTVYTLPDARNGKSPSEEIGNWTSGEWAEYDAPVVAGYTASQPTVSAKTVTGDTQNETIDITYVASEHTSHVKLVDNDNKTIQDTPVTGKTGETANVSVTIPKGWQLTQGQELPAQISFNAEGHPDVIVQIEHKTIKVTPDNPKENGTVLPDNPSVHFNGVSHDDLNKTVTREVTITDPTGKKSTTTQTVTFTRGATVDEVTNKVTYDDWSENGKHTFDKVDVPNVQGYTASGEVPSIVVTPETQTQSSKVNITYTANAQTATITYIDDTEKKILGSDTQNGKFNQAITFEHDPAEVIKGLEEKGYKLVSDNFKPGIKYQNDNKLNIFEVHLVHTYEPVETSQTITETVHYIDANGKPVAPDHVAKVVIEVTGTRDKVTDSITWNTPSIGHFNEVISPEVPNMTPDKKLIPGRDVQYGDSDITENVVYTPDKMPREPEKPNKPDNSTSKTQEKPNKPDNSTSKTPEKPRKLDNPTSKTPEKPNKPSKEVSKQFGTIVKTTITEKPIDSRTVDNHASAKSTAKRELPQTGATTNTGIWTGLVSMIASLGLLGA